MAAQAGGLFGLDAPAGFAYHAAFITLDEERALAAAIAEHVTFSAFEMRGVVARRRVAFFGHSYDAGRAASPEVPSFLLPVRDRLAAWIGVTPASFAMALVNEYPPGAPIGWHRDAPQYDLVAGLSLLSPCRMRFRPYERAQRAAAAPSRRRSTSHEVLLEPRSVYVLRGDARSAYEHHIPAVATLRYSITFRTLRG
jgi:alkylated DNA repair dioxygenase AlkB